MIITATSIRLKSVWYFFKLSYFGMHIVRQTRSQKGFIKMKNTGFGYMHYTLSAWQSAEEMKQFARTGAHLEAMKHSAALSTEIRTITYESAAMPTWEEAKKLLQEKGKVLTF